MSRVIAIGSELYVYSDAVNQFAMKGHKKIRIGSWDVLIDAVNTIHMNPLTAISFPS